MSAPVLSGNTFIAAPNTKTPVMTSLATSIRLVTGVATTLTLFTVPADGTRFVPTYLMIRDASASQAALVASVRKGATTFGTIATATAPSTSLLATLYPMGTQVGTTGVQATLLPLNPSDVVTLVIATPSAGATDTAVFDLYGFWVEGV